MPLPFIVVDQNQIGCADVIAVAMDQCRRERLQVLVADVAGFEFSKVVTKAGDPLLTWKHSLQAIAPFSGHVVLARKLTDVWKEEINEGAPCGRIVDDKATELFRNLLREINAGNESGLHELIDGSVRRLMPHSLDHWSNGEEHKVMLRKVHDFLRSSLAEETIKDLRRTRTADGLIAWLSAWLSSSDGVRFVFQGIQARGAGSRGRLDGPDSQRCDTSAKGRTRATAQLRQVVQGRETQDHRRESLQEKEPLPPCQAGDAAQILQDGTGERPAQDACDGGAGQKAG
jgi:hypothetical protein